MYFGRMVHSLNLHVLDGGLDVQNHIKTDPTSSPISTSRLCPDKLHPAPAYRNRHRTQLGLITVNASDTARPPMNAYMFVRDKRLLP